MPIVTLEQRKMAHAEELYPVLAEEALCEFLEEEPPRSVDDLRSKLERSESRRSPDGNEHWLNWVVRDASGRMAGYVQATVAADLETNVAYVIGSNFWGRGIATEAVTQMLRIVAGEYGAKCFVVVADRRNTRSVRLARRLGFVEVSVDKRVGRVVAPTDILMRKLLA